MSERQRNKRADEEKRDEQKPKWKKMGDLIKKKHTIASLKEQTEEVKGTKRER